MAQCGRIIDGLRKVNAKIVRLGGSLDSLTSAADQVESLPESLSEVTRARAMESEPTQKEVSRGDPRLC